MTGFRRFDHVGITVADLDVVSGFFVGLGWEVEGRTFLEGEFLDTVIGTRFLRPGCEPSEPAVMATRLGLSNVSFEVDGLQALLERLAADGYGLIGGVGEYEGTWRMASVRGPEGIIVNLAERIG